MATTLYRIYDPRFSEKSRYYGITNGTIENRMAEHLHMAKTNKKRMPLYDWIRKIQNEGIQPCIEIVCVFETRQQGILAEIEYIANGRKLGYKLLNLANGGDGGRQPDEVIKRISISKKLHAKNNPDQYKKLAEIGQNKMKEIRESDPNWEQARIDAIKDGIKPGQRSEAQRKRMNENPELKLKLSHRYKGKPRIGIGRRKPIRSSDGLEFDTGKAAAKYYQIHPNTVTWSLTNTESIYAKGRSVSFVYINPEHEKERNKKRKVISSEGLEFSNITEAAKYYKADWVTIQRAIKEQRSYKGITFSLELIDTNKPEIIYDEIDY